MKKVAVFREGFTDDGVPIGFQVAVRDGASQVVGHICITWIAQIEIPRSSRLDLIEEALETLEK